MKKFMMFMTPMCPNCGEIKDWLEENPDILSKGEIVDATQPEGLEKAKKYDVTGVPTIVFLDEKDEKIAEAKDLDEFQELLNNKQLSDF